MVWDTIFIVFREVKNDLEENWAEIGIKMKSLEFYMRKGLRFLAENL